MNDHPPALPSPYGQLLPLVDAAARMSVSVKTVRRMIRSGQLPYYQAGRLLRIGESDLAKYMAARRECRPAGQAE